MESGTKLGHYEIEALLGKGGMGEVYRANDTSLNRQVAIKVLPTEFAQDTERLARFEREAKTLAALNHPNIAQIYGFEKSTGVHALVMELVEGPTLADRIAQGPIPVNEALPIARQIAEALEAAHEQGVIHRDLKPANIKVKTDGMVKVLDFGLAKAMEQPGTSPNVSQSPTLSMAATQAGIILGTAAYMSPEQARGVAVDKRADVWAFGCILHEMLTARQVFGGELMSDVIASVLKTEPDYAELPPLIHPSLQGVLQRCLEKDPKRRFRDIGDVAYELLAIQADPDGSSLSKAAAPVRSSRPSMLPWAVTVVAVLAAVALAFLPVTNDEAEPGLPVRLSVTLPAGEEVHQDSPPALSDDGSMLAYVSERNGAYQLCIRYLASWESQCTPMAGPVELVFFSPDGQRLGFVILADQMKILEIGSGRITDIADQASTLGAAWHPDGDTIISNRRYTEGLSRISASGGEPEPLTTPDSEGELGHFWPQVLPDGKSLIFTRFTSPPERSEISALDLDTLTVKTLREGVVFGRYIDTGDLTGHLLYVRYDTLFAAPFDLERMEVIGDEQAVQEGVFFRLADVQSDFAVSGNATLAYIPSAAPRELVWVDLDGNEELVTDRRDSYRYPSVSPDGTQIVYQLDPGIPEIWRYDLERDAPDRLAAGDTSNLDPIFSPDGSFVVFQSEATVWNLHRVSTIDRDVEELLITSEDKFPTSFSQDGGLMVYSEPAPATDNHDLWTFSLADLEPQRFTQTPDYEETHGVLSSSLGLIAYQSDFEGPYEIFVQSFAQPDSPFTKVSIDGGKDPQWSRDGRTLFYRSATNFMAMHFGENLSPGVPETLFPDVYDGPYRSNNSYDTTPDGRLLMVKTPPELAPRQVHVILNWFQELRERVPVD